MPSGLLCLITAIVYVASARIGQLFGIEPGNVTPIWLPSGLMLAAVLYFGYRVWPGIFAGAFVGNAWAYWSWEGLEPLGRAIGSALFNGVGDSLGIVLAAALILHYAEPSTCLRNRRGLLMLALPAAWGLATISALFGVGGLWLFDHINSEQASTVFITWLVGDAVGALVIAPFALSWLLPPKKEEQLHPGLTLGTLAYSALIAMLLFDLIKLPESWGYALTLMLPPLFYVLLNQGTRLVYTFLFLVNAVAVWATSLGLGPLAGDTEGQALLELQLFAAIFSFSLFTMALLGFEQQDARRLLTQRQSELERLYRQDALTGVWNRYRIKEFIERELLRFNRGGAPFGVVLIDIDNFKEINDEYGHLVGDEVLVSLSRLLSEHIRENDLIGRWGGEEFIVIATDTNRDSIMTLAEKLRTLALEGSYSQLNLKVTISIGVTLATTGDTELRLLDRADEALYEAKDAGKNRVRLQQATA